MKITLSKTCSVQTIRRSAPAHLLCAVAVVLCAARSITTAGPIFSPRSIRSSPSVAATPQSPRQPASQPPRPEPSPAATTSEAWDLFDAAPPAISEPPARNPLQSADEVNPERLPLELFEPVSLDPFESPAEPVSDAVTQEQPEPAPQELFGATPEVTVERVPLDLFESDPPELPESAAEGMSERVAQQQPNPVSQEHLESAPAVESETAPLELFEPVPRELLGTASPERLETVPRDLFGREEVIPVSAESFPAADEADAWANDETGPPKPADVPRPLPEEHEARSLFEPDPTQTPDLLEPVPTTTTAPLDRQSNSHGSVLPFNRIRDLESQKRERFEQLGDLLESLGNRVDQACPAPQPVAAPVPDTGVPQPGTESQVVDTTDDGNIDATTDAAQTPGTTPPEATPVEEGILGERRMTAVHVVDQPVDRAALADSLFAIGEFAFALDAYRRVDSTEADQATRLWLRYQTACCLRRLGQTSDAAREYRRVTAEADAGWIGEQAKWWLELIESRRILTERVEQMRETIDTLQGHADAGSNQSL